ncbi:uncharacterized protein LOC143617089 [Bidens hawaiensis]|uniref:uncharacterized protein LOC143617089 n=1 Tax=Bidens hawaiensis TaxID=980011 RepID=UPI0040497DF2
MDSMDLKGIAWVGHIYQKFEAMCLEVEEAMSQETAKYVENQVQTVGAGMKRFCSDVMQDLLPPSSKDLSRVAAADLSLNPYLEFGIHKKPVSSIKEDDATKISPVRVKGISENKSNSKDDLWEDWSAASFNWEISDKDEENNSARMVTKALNEKPSTTVFSKSRPKIVNRSRRVSSSNIVRAERIGTCESSGSNTSTSQSVGGVVSHTDLCENNAHACVSSISSNVINNTKCGQSVGDEVFRPDTGSSADCDTDLVEETKNDANEQIMEPIGHESDSEFEETCVLVDGSDFCINHKQEIRRSYKKKIQNAFSLKKKSARKQEYKQLATQYNTVDAETNIKSDVAITPACALSSELATHDLLETEWELL